MSPTRFRPSRIFEASASEARTPCSVVLLGSGPTRASWRGAPHATPPPPRPPPPPPRRLGAAAPHDPRVPAPLPLELVRDQPVEPRARLPVDPPRLVPRGVLPQAPELRPGTDRAGRDLPDPEAGGGGGGARPPRPP